MTSFPTFLLCTFNRTYATICWTVSSERSDSTDAYPSERVPPLAISPDRWLYERGRASQEGMCTSSMCMKPRFWPPRAAGYHISYLDLQAPPATDTFDRPLVLAVASLRNGAAKRVTRAMARCLTYRLGPERRPSVPPTCRNDLRKCIIYTIIFFLFSAPWISSNFEAYRRRVGRTYMHDIFDRMSL